MPRRRVYTDVMDVLERKIVSGEYMLRDLPGERRLAEELGVSYMTARKAVLGLIDKDVLSRRSNGSLVIHPRFEVEAGRCQVALLTPAYPSPHFVHCRLALSRATSERDIQFRPVEYMYWEDSIVREAIEGSDGLFVIPSTDEIPERVMKALMAPGARVVMFDDDKSELGLPSVRLFGRSHIEAVFEHLWSLGHRRIHCLNAQGHNDEIERRIGHWESWLRERGGTGELWDNPAPAYQDPVAMAHEEMRRVLEQDTGDALLGGAVVCTTQPAAVGAMRACYDVGLRIGRDLSICTVNNEPTGRYFCPSLTGLEMPDIEPLLDRCLTWFAAEPGTPWRGPLRIEPKEPTLFRGESTGPA
ncbi:MAG: substrate-binding domain-containing protein [Phycisphaerales bacterium JB040]